MRARFSQVYKQENLLLSKFGREDFPGYFKIKKNRIKGPRGVRFDVEAFDYYCRVTNSKDFTDKMSLYNNNYNTMSDQFLLHLGLSDADILTNNKISDFRF